MASTSLDKSGGSLLWMMKGEVVSKYLHLTIWNLWNLLKLYWHILHKTPEVPSKFEELSSSEKNASATEDLFPLIAQSPHRPVRNRTLSENSSAKTTGKTTSWPRGILKRRGRSLSESNLGLSPTFSLLGSSAEMTNVAETDEDDEPATDSISSSVKKSVTFDDVVKSQVFRINSSILGQRAKNQRKAAKKKRCAERHSSECSDQAQVEEQKLLTSTTEDDLTEVDLSDAVDNILSLSNDNTNVDDAPNNNEPDDNVSIENEIQSPSSQSNNNDDNICDAPKESESKGKSEKTSKANKKKKNKRNKKNVELSNNMIFQLDLES